MAVKRLPLKIVHSIVMCDPKSNRSIVFFLQKMYELLKPSAKLVGLLFDKQFEGGPPFGGSKTEYEILFAPYFNIKTIEPAYNSIKPRAGVELFCIFQKNDFGSAPQV